MFLKKVSDANVRFLLKRTFYRSAQILSDKKYENPIYRTFRILGSDVMKLFEEETPKGNNLGALVKDIPTHTDVVIIGGGAIGSSIAYWLKEKSNENAFSVVVLEKDLTYKSCSTRLSVGGLRQQFSLQENVQMALYGAEFIRTLKKKFGPNADVNFTPHGNLILAGEQGAEQLIGNSRLQKEFGAVNMVLNKHHLKDRFPWLNIDDIEVGCLGLENEGWFNPWSLLHIIKNGAIAKNTQYINANVVDFMFETRTDLRIEGLKDQSFEHAQQVVFETPDGKRRSMTFSLCIIAAGAETSKITQLLNIGTGHGVLSVPLPIERRKRLAYTFSCPENPPGLNTPHVIDSSGVYFRREGLGGDFIAGFAPEFTDEPEETNLGGDYDLWDSTLLPILTNRVPAFSAAKLTHAWGGYYGLNRYDQNGIIGSHPYYTNIYLATGFSGQGIQQAPAVGRAVAELVLDGKFQTIDLTRLGFDRLFMEKPMYESEVF